MLASTVVFALRSRMKTSETPFVSPSTRFVAAEVNATLVPSAEIDEEVLSPLPSTGGEPPPTLTRLVVCVVRSRTKTSETPFVSPSTRFDATESKATYRPSAEIEGEKLPPFDCTPELPTLTRLFSRVVRS
jgi:hypothetical protein